MPLWIGPEKRRYRHVGIPQIPDDDKTSQDLSQGSSSRLPLKLANALWRGQEKRTMREIGVQIGNSW